MVQENFKIITGTTWSIFQEDVNNALKNGWALNGETAHHKGHDEYGEHIQFYQPLKLISQ